MSAEILDNILKGVFKEQQVIKIRVEKRKGHREVTVITGLDTKDPDLRKMVSELKSLLACGGTIKDDHVELQGDHRHKVKEFLIARGFAESNIIVE
ncbi:stress response translation initiation inhibitor YciH [Infirmifilum sp. NZ]|uniref:stress response translation initiation inhibitor YciH n=1 Tax=Infirmifilum sp. NZ TaxID=2926850 RepID=UPI00279C8AEF|nr:stress response translation initiation inhibitor YciH [Infirmifilum sp. NZ]UNQ72586.1 stress response translation initiation inhibitor YciH [Infirmifilum sp. NZ]